MELTYPLPPSESRWDPRSTRILPERNGHCFWCGEKLTGRRKSWCCDSHGQKYSDHFSWEGVKTRVKNRDGGKCCDCGAEIGWDGECDHIIAISLGGEAWNESNLQWLCVSCHKKKTRRDMGILARKRRGINEPPLMYFIRG